MAPRRSRVGELLTIDEVAAFLKVSRPHVYRLIAAGALPTEDVGVPGPRRKPKTRVRDTDLQAYAADATVHLRARGAA